MNFGSSARLFANLSTVPTPLRSCDYTMVGPAKSSLRGTTVHALVSVFAQLKPLYKYYHNPFGRYLEQVRITSWRPEISSSSSRIRVSAKWSASQKECSCARSFSCTAMSSNSLIPRSVFTITQLILAYFLTPFANVRLYTSALYLGPRRPHDCKGLTTNWRICDFYPLQQGFTGFGWVDGIILISI